MPPRRARPSSAAQATSSLPAASDPGDDPLPPFFNTTYAIHRASPLHLGARPLTESRLEQLARRLRETLVGDVVRGIQIGLEAADTPAGQVGPLRAVHIRWFRADAVLGGGGPSHDWDGLPDEKKRGLWIEIRHENASYAAVLLPGYAARSPGGAGIVGAASWAMRPDDAPHGRGETDSGRFLHLPLLLLRMPRQLQGVIADWLSATFDCRVSRVTLGTRTIVGAWEQWLQIAGLPTKGPNIAVTLAFNAPLAQKDTQVVADSDDEIDEEDGADKAGLRSMTVTISAQDLRRFVRAGETAPPSTRTASTRPWDSDARERRRLAGGNADDGWAWRAGGDPAAEQPFTEALAAHLGRHLALDVFHPGVRVAQISCGGFVLARSRLKVVGAGEMGDDLSRAAWMFVTRLGERIRGDAMPAVF